MKNRDKCLNLPCVARVVFSNDISHVTQRGNDRQNIFQEARDILFVTIFLYPFSFLLMPEFAIMVFLCRQFITQAREHYTLLSEV